MAGEKLIQKALQAARQASGPIPKNYGSFSGTKLPDAEKLARLKDKFIYHSGTADQLEGMKWGLEPQHGGWIEELAQHAGDIPPQELLDRSVPLVWMSDEPSWVSMKVGRKLNKPAADVTQQDILEHGHLAVIPRKGEHAENVWKVGEEGLMSGEYSPVTNLKGETKKAGWTDLYQNDYTGNKGPFGVESNEYISAQPVEPMFNLTGQHLVDFLNAANRGEKSYGGEVDAALHAVRHHLAGGGFLSDLFSGPDYLSTGEAASPTNWGDPESAADFFKADRALRLAREVQAADDVTGSVPARAPLTAPRPGAVEVQELPVNIPFAAPERGASLLSSDISPASVTSLPLAFTAAPTPAPASAAIDQATGKMTARIPEEPHGTALTKQQADYVIRTIAAETSGKSPEETQAIASVILNRINSGKYGSSPEAVLFAKRQFEPWMNPAGANYPMKISPTSQRYSDARDALEAAMAGEDITRGATNFWAPAAQEALGRPAPAWGRTGGVDIGATRFHKLERAEGGEVEGYDKGGVIKKALQAAKEAHAKRYIADPLERDINLGKFLQGTKTVNDEGDLFKLYHITKGDISEFIPGGPGAPSSQPSGPAIWLSANPEYLPATHNVGYPGEYAAGTNVMPLWASMKNPLVVEKGFSEQKYGSGFPFAISPEGREKLIADGYDSVINRITQSGQEEYLALHPNQLKSATGNAGTFDSASPRIEENRGGSVDDALRVVREHHADGEAVGQAPFFTFEPTPDSVDRQAARQPAYNPAERTWSDAGSTEGERLTRALGVEGELPKGETTMSAAPTGWEKYMPQRVPGTYLKRTGEAFGENADAVTEGLKAIREGNYGSGALGMVGGGLGMALSPLTGMERVLVRDPYLRVTGNLKDAQAAEMVADAALTGGMRGPAKQLLGKGIEGMATDPWAKMRLPSPAATGAATAAAATLAPEDAEAGNVDRILRGLRAYHGSPYKFDRFDLSKIGAGEGVQAFGHGLYFAEHEPTAKYYRDTLAHKGAIDLEQAAHERGLPLSIDAQREIRRQASGSMEPLAAAKWAQYANSEMRPFDREKLADLIDTYRQSRTGHMYEVNIDADPDRLLNFNKTFKEQSRPVQEGIRYAFGPQPLDARIGSSTMDRPGPIHSRLLNEAGIPGIKYLDAGSRGITGAPTHNYVIFDDKLIDINRRYAQGGQIPEGNYMREHFEKGGLSAALKLARRATSKGSAETPIFPQVAERYPAMVPPVPAIDKKTGKEFLAKTLSPEAVAVQKARIAAQKEINAGNYEPYFPIEQRFDVDPSNYPEINPNTSDLIRMKLPKAVAGYEAKARDPQALENLRTGFEHGLKQKDMAENWYYMGQLEAEFIKEYGPEMGRTLFKQRFPDAMAATTGGADPTSNLMMAHFGNYLHNLGKKMPTKAYEYPFPVAGGKYGIQGNMDQYRKMIMEGEGLTPENPKRYNFSANFLGKKTPTIDEQMSGAWDPKMASPPTGSYGHYEGALTDLSNSMGYDPRYFQEVGWAGIKDMKTPGGFKAQPMIGIVNEAIERTHQITGMPRDEIVRRGLVRAEIPLYGAAGATAAGAMGPEFMQGQGEAPAPEAAEAPMTEERKRGGSIVDRALMLVSRQA